MSNPWILTGVAESLDFGLDDSDEDVTRVWRAEARADSVRLSITEEDPGAPKGWGPPALYDVTVKRVDE
ncbi:MAG: hypothetical protein ACRCSN_19765 [Dermatophilaceae bacterium]